MSAIYRPIKKQCHSLLTAIPDIETEQSELPTGSQTHVSKIQEKSTRSHNSPKVPSPDVTGNAVPGLESVTNLSAVKETVTEIVPEVPEIVREVPVIVPEVPEIVTEVPEIVPEVATIVPEVPEIVPEVPEIVPDFAENVSTSVPKIELHVPVIVPEVPVIVPDVPETTLDVKSDAPATVKALGKKRAISSLEDSLSKNEKVVGKRVRYR